MGFLLMFHRHVYMIISEVVTLAIYALSMVFLPEYFGASSCPTPAYAF
jgi:phospholipid-translocating ATPase